MDVTKSAKIDEISTKMTSQPVGPSQLTFAKNRRSTAFTAEGPRFRENHGYPLVVFTKSEPKSAILGQTCRFGDFWILPDLTRFGTSARPQKQLGEVKARRRR